MPRDRQILLTTAGNLATSQAVVKTLSEQIKDKNNGSQSILNAPTMFQVARIVSQTLAEVIDVSSKWHQKAENKFSANFILGGQINNSEMALYLIYPEGNFIYVADETPFIQIGETKYGKPILDRMIVPNTPLGDSARAALLSFDSTMKSDLTVGPPIDFVVFKRDQINLNFQDQLKLDSPFFKELSSIWAEQLDNAIHALPKFNWEE